MQIIDTEIPDVKIIVPQVHKDTRGYFYESFNLKKFTEKIRHIDFVQDNQSLSQKGSFRGLHYQLPPFAQTKLVRVTEGKVLDIAVDIRVGSPTFGKYVAVELTSENQYQLFIPRGFAHGFVVLSEQAIFQYKVDNFYSKEHDRGIKYNDAKIGLKLPFVDEALLSQKDIVLPSFAEAEKFSYSEDLYD